MKRTELPKLLRTGALALLFALLTLTATVYAQTNTNNANTAILRADTSDSDDGSDLGWLNWLGLLGLLGLMPRKPVDVRVRSGAPADVGR